MTMTAGQKRIKDLAASPEFDARIRQDPVIQDLIAQKRKKTQEQLLLVEALGGAISVAGIPVLPLSPAKWAVLYMTGNAFANFDAKETKVEHIDQFMWLLTHDLAELDTFEQLSELAENYCENNQIDLCEAIDDILQIIDVCFYPLQMLHKNGTGETPEFGAEWIARICCEAHAASGIPVTELMHKTALSTVCFFFVENQRRLDTKLVIRKPSDREIDAAIMARIRALMEEK